MGRIRVVRVSKRSKPSPAKLRNFSVTLETLHPGLALTPGSTGLIAKLADGLQQFIGYDGGKLSDRSTPKITGAGILPANVAKYQVCNAVLNFIIRFLDGLCGIKELNDSGHKQNVLAVIVKLRKCVGTGTVPEGFKELVQKIGDKVKDGFDSKINQSIGGQTGKLYTVFTALKSIVTEKFQTEHHTHDVKNETQNVQNYIDAVNNNVNADGSGKFKDLNDNLQKLLGELKRRADDESAAVVTRTLTNFNNVKPDSINADIHTLRTESKFKDHALATVFSAVRDAAIAFIAELQTKAYTSFYNGVNNKDVGALSPYVESSRTGAHIAETALGELTEFQQGMAGASSPPTFPYASFTAELQKKVGMNSSNLSTDCPLSALFYGASCYFQCQQIKNAKETSKSPKTIREMLYFLAALQFSPQYDAFDKYVTEYFKALLGKSQDDDSELKLQVADSGTSNPNNTLSAADVKSHLLSTAIFIPSALGLLQGYSTSNYPWLHELYSNSAFPFQYPSSGAALLYALSDYTYSLQFQLGFLYQQCSQLYVNMCGWFMCNYGQGVNTNSSKGKVVSSHICPAGCTKQEHKNSDKFSEHKSGDCEHDGCGTANNRPSPLQAFLSDNLKGFSRGHPSAPSSHLATCSGFLCHVPMAFKAKYLRPGSKYQGGHISLALKPFCGSHNTPLRQLCGTLSCLSKRAPRSLGGLFGFYWQLTGQLFNKAKDVDHDPSNNLSNAISALLQKLTTVESNLLYATLTANVKAIGNHFFGLSWHCHRKYQWKTVERSNATGYCDDHTSHKVCDLMSLYDSECTGNNVNCGKYLESLGISSGATFADRYAFTYLSWAAYLTDNLYESLHEFLDTLNAHGCRNCGICSNGHSGSTCKCQCRSVVECSDVLPHLYAYGFSFHNAYWSRGRYYTNNQWEDNSNKRTCANFHSQLHSVVSGNPLSNLLTSIDEFLFLFRYYFLTNLSGFWSIYICLIRYTFFFLLDTLHMRSHLKLTASHTLPPLALLTSGNPLPVTKLTYIGQ
ncbi:variant erythrocyte surface antigen-1 family protein [Babesia caballi]|uniref:Variant erythrocyte surface antigen-1 family protein n=1 Tax=Babesia caballi TaxID=5871 RepID=A0AAV4LY31_BABCB|nr:variant erythrocyte surface antigen-1 family protein [Babesia caballi]